MYLFTIFAQIISIYSAWNVFIVLNTLQLLIDKSQIKIHLSNGGVSTERECLPPLHMLGFFSIVGLVRLHALFGDYQLALRNLDCVQFGQKTLYARVPFCQISLFYHLGIFLNHIFAFNMAIILKPLVLMCKDNVLIASVANVNEFFCSLVIYLTIQSGLLFV